MSEITDIVVFSKQCSYCRGFEGWWIITDLSTEIFLLLTKSINYSFSLQYGNKDTISWLWRMNMLEISRQFIFWRAKGIDVKKSIFFIWRYCCKKMKEWLGRLHNLSTKNMTSGGELVQIQVKKKTSLIEILAFIFMAFILKLLKPYYRIVLLRY